MEELTFVKLFFIGLDRINWKINVVEREGVRVFVSVAFVFVCWRANPRGLIWIGLNL